MNATIPHTETRASITRRQYMERFKTLSPEERQAQYLIALKYLVQLISTPSEECCTEGSANL